MGRFGSRGAAETWLGSNRKLEIGAVVKTSRSFLMILPFLIAGIGVSHGDEPRRPAAPRAEKVARASWTPVREAKQQNVRRAQATENIPALRGSEFPPQSR